MNGTLPGAWDWGPEALFGCLLFIAGYAALVRGRWSREAAWFGLALVLVVVALASPLATLAHHLLSAHMLQHFLLVMLMPPLLLAGIPERAALRRRLPVFKRPAACWLCGMGAMALWQIPALFNSSLHHRPLHFAGQIAFSVTAVVFWWPIFDPVRRARLHPIA